MYYLCAHAHGEESAAIFVTQEALLLHLKEGLCISRKDSESFLEMQKQSFLVTAMAVPVFEGEKWRRLDSNLCVRYSIDSIYLPKVYTIYGYRMPSPSGLP